MVICGVYKPSGSNMDIKVGSVDGRNSHHVYGRNSHPSPESNNSEVKREPEKERPVTQDEEDCSPEVDDKICKKARELNKQKRCKPRPAGPSKSRSSHLMPATGQTYDRPSIQAWLDGGHRTCPKTHQVLPDLTLEALFSNPNPSANEKDSEGMTPQDHTYLTALVQLRQREAARKIRALTKDKQLDRAHLAQEEQVISVLILFLSSTDSETQEHAVTALYNLSILDANKKLIVEKGAVQPMLDVLRKGSMPARENAAAALSNLSEVLDNKIVIGESGAIPALVQLLCEGKIDAAYALLRLCTYQRNRTECVHEGVVPVLLKLMKNEDRSMVACALAILVLLARNEECGSDIREAIKYSSDCNKENALVMLFALFSRESSEEGDGYVALLDLSTSRTERAKRKARALLKQI